MSYGMSASLQRAVYQRLLGNAALQALVGTAVFDALPSGDLPRTYVSLGPEEVRDASDASGPAATHRFTVSVVSTEAGFCSAKGIAAAITDTLAAGDLELGRGRLAGLWFERASARRSGRAGQVRRIDLRFRAHVEDD
ncbi:DUF3168 domain-containing protein [Pukyongiella litopenaei]|uniref:DUF3168 domain-containing protein n=1 Tax=Pukyongiella litopenaei TaxID=2605946 RepID=A0A2S0MRI1_9RHOB|nr:DUF3168 domain-containing protein [Pukyongiella litopenaei]AVO38509.1 DUF3168 domain-containing protein [Pukyongiella litopenaei]